MDQLLHTTALLFVYSLVQFLWNLLNFRKPQEPLFSWWEPVEGMLGLYVTFAVLNEMGSLVLPDFFKAGLGPAYVLLIMAIVGRAVLPRFFPLRDNEQRGSYEARKDSERLKADRETYYY